MHIVQAAWRQLWERLPTESLVEAQPLLDEWLTTAEAEREHIARLADLHTGQVPRLTDDDRYFLYALSRVNQQLLRPFQRSPELPARADLDTYLGFWTRLGVTLRWPKAFHPFLCEFVACEAISHLNTPIELVSARWPSLWLGDMLLTCSGCDVAVEASGAIDPRVASRSQLYWAYHRENRPASDLSHGWGSNSQWRTSERRDCYVDGVCHYNVIQNASAKEDSEDVNDWPLERRDEIVRYRCAIQEPVPVDSFPYDWTCQESAELKFSDDC